jgi:hypothetical protein
MMCDYNRAASLFTPDGVLRMPYVNVELSGRLEVHRARLRDQVP